MLELFKRFDISKVNLLKGCLRLSIFTTSIAFLWVFFIESPKHTSIAFGISDQDARDLRKTADIEINGHRYAYKEGKDYHEGTKIENKYKIEELDEWISDDEKNQIIKKYSDYWFPYGLGYTNKYICRASYSCDDIIDRALKRIVQSETSMDYSTGYLVSNQKFGITQSSWSFVDDGEHHVSVGYSPNGYSIVPSFGEKEKWCTKIAAICALLMFFFTSVLLPLACHILYYAILTPLKLIAMLRDYFRWVRRGFI